MIFRIRLFLLLGLLFIVPMPTAARSAPPTAATAPQATDGLDVLPGGCGGGLPSNGQQVCCVSGYVFLDGVPVAGAKVTVTNSNTAPNPRSAIVVTKNGPDSRFPYYHVDLNTDLQVKPNDQISIHVEYEGRVGDVPHYNTLAGGQQVDVVLPRSDTSEDYTFQETIGNQGADGQLRTPVGVAVDRTGSIYVADRDTFSIQVFYNDNSNNLFRRRWGTRGTKPGQFGDIGGIALDDQGNVYVAHGRISKFSSTGALLDEWGARPDFGSDGVFDNAQAVAVDSTGTVYGVGGSSVNTGWLRKRTPDGTWIHIPTRDGTGPIGFSFALGVAVDGAGDIYVGDTQNNRVLKFAPDGLLIAKWDIVGSADGEFNSPQGVSVDASGNVYVADANNNRIHKLSVITGTWSTFAGTGNAGSQTGQFAAPWGLTVAPDGNIYVADRDNLRIQKIPPSGNSQQIAVAIPVGQLIPGQLTHPSGIARDNSGNIYVGDSANSRLQRFSPGAAPRVLVQGRGVGPGQFSALRGVAVDTTGNIYVADAGSSNRIQKFDSNGTFITQWNGTESIDGHPPAGTFNQPYDIAVDSNATPPSVYVTDQFNQRIVKFTNNGGFLWAKTGQDIGIGAFGTLLGIAVAPDGSVFVTDTANDRIVKLTADGTLVGTPWTSPSDVNRTFRSPAGISVDASGNVYVMTANDNPLSKPLPDKPLLKLGPDRSLRAEWSAFVGFDEGYVYGNFLTVDAQGTIYYSDEQNNRLQVFRQIGPHRPPVATITQVRTQNMIAPVTIQSGEQLYLFGLGSTDSTATQSLSYEWMDNGVLLSTAQSPIVSFSTKGLHTISLRVYDPADPTNLSASVSTSVTVADLVPAAVWTMILYLDGDNSGTAGLAGAVADLKREIAENPNSVVRVVALYDGSGNDDSSYYVQQGNTLTEQKLGEADMGDPQTLVNLISWAKRDAPAQHYYLAIADHGNGLDGIAWDYHPGAGATTDYLDNGKIRRALEQSRQILGQPIDVLHLDACLMGLIEIAYQVRDLANFEVSSENLAWSAFAYADYRAQIDANTTPAALAQIVADRYQAQVLGLPYTIAALDLSQVTNVTTQLGALADALRRYAQASQANRDQLLAIRNQAQKFDSNGNYVIEPTDLYIDLDHWAELVAGANGVSDTSARSAATALRTALGAFIIREHHDSGSISSIPVSLDHARGIAIYYPYQPTATSQAKYTNGDLDFVRDSAWDTYLAAGLDPLPPNQTAPQPNPIGPLILRTRVYIPLISR